MSEDWNSALNKKEKELFSPNAESIKEIRHDAPINEAQEFPNAWGDSGNIITPIKTNRKSFGLKFLVIAAAVFLLALAYAGYRIVSKNNVVSNNQIEITLTLKPYVEGGEITKLTYSVHNKNNLPLLNASLTFTYDKGTGQEEAQNKIREKIDIGSIEPDEIRQGEIEIQLFGAENTQREVSARLDYKVEGSNAVFNKSASVSTILKSPPVSILIDAPPSVSADEPYPFSITVKNNTSATAEVLLVSLTLPSSYVVRSTSIKPINRNNVWKFTGLLSGEEKKIDVDGYFKGLPGELVSIKAVVGSEGASNAIGNIYAYDIRDLTLAAPSLRLTVRVTKDGGGVLSTLTPASRATGVISYENTSEYDLTFFNIVAKITGPYVRSSLNADSGGLYDSRAGTIVWSGGSTEFLEVISPKEKGDLTFTFEVGQVSETPIIIGAIAQAKNETLGTDITSSESKQWTIQGSANIASKLTYKTGFFSNTGPLPPKVGENTSYSVTLSASTENNSTRGRMSLSLPLYTAYLASPQGSGVIYNEKSRVLTWDIGDMPARTEKSATFQIMFHPSQTHVGQMPALTSQIAFEAIDSVTSQSIKKFIPAITSLLLSEGGEAVSKVVE